VSSSVTVPAGETREIWATISVAGSTFQTGSVTVTATDQGNASANDNGSINVTVAPSGPVLERGLCLTIAAGAGAAYECGDLRLTHALPSVRTLNTRRAPVLLYNSQHARPYPLLYADVTAPSPLPQTIRAIVRLGGVTYAQRDVPSSVWGSAGQVRRIVVGFLADTTTGLYNYELEIQRVDGSNVVSLQTITGQMPIVNRKASPFGPGWWLAGWERLSFTGLPAGQVMWIAGDGSVRRYERAGAVGTDTAYLATLVDSPDTLLHTATNEWKRLLAGGGYISFTATGYHRRTTNRLGYQTEFVLDSLIDWKLLKIRIPPDTSISYTFSYSGTPARLASVSAPDSAVGTFRVTSLTYIGDTLKITDPASPAVGYRYETGATNRIVSRKNRRGALTAFAYDAGSRLGSSALGIPGADSIKLAFCAAEVSGLAACSPTPVVPDSAYTRFDGPRPAADSADVHSYWIDRFGGPWKIRDPYNNLTTVTRAEPSFPALATRVQYPNGRIVAATYDVRGNLASTTDSSALGPGLHATSRYQWDQRWDEVTEIVVPTGQISRFGYDAANGNRLWQEDGRGTSSRVTFGYYTSGSGAGLVRFVTVPGGAKDSLGYDTRGNLNATRTPLGWLTYFDNDRLGRTTLVRAQIGGSQWRHDSTFYDVKSQVMRTVAYGPLLGSAPAQSLHTRSFYNDEGQVNSLQRWSMPDTAQVGTIVTRWRYDLAGRRVAEEAPDHLPSAPRVDSTSYDAAGNARLVITRRGDTISMVYDRLNRLRQRTVPAVTYYGRYQGIATYPLNFSGRRPYPRHPTNLSPDSAIACQVEASCYQDSTRWTLTIPGDIATFAYDVMGNLTRADNSAALIRRGYFTNGLLRADTLKIRTYSGTDTLQHVYVNEHRYDLAGRRIVLKHPSQIAARVSGAVKDSARYVFDAVTGALQNVIDPLGNTFTFTYNLRNERIRLDFPGGISQYQGYDTDGRLVADTMISMSSSSWRIGAPTANPITFRRARLHYGDALRVDTAANALGRQDTTVATYSGLGHLVQMEWRQPAVTAYGNPSRIYSTERFSLDGLGNAYSTYDSTNAGWRGGFGAPGSSGFILDLRYARFGASTGRLRASEDLSHRRDTMHYDAAGNTVFSSSSPKFLNKLTVLEDRAYFYGADGQLRLSEYRRLPRDPAVTSEDWDWSMTSDEYRYDALGRRVLVRTRRNCREGIEEFSAPCDIGSLRRTVWDGAAELYEIQVFGGWRDNALDPAAESDTTNVFLGMPWAQQAQWDPNPQFGRVAYTHGPGLDQPLSLTRINFVDTVWNDVRVNWAPLTIVPHWNWRGQADYGTMADGGWKTCLTPSSSRCVSVTWSGKQLAYVQQQADLGRWWGSVITLKEDGTGTLFRRNRYLDPVTGRFTQEDPIGLAGGLNLYGFANGDPVNFSDPFGLCPPEDNNWTPACDEPLIDESANTFFTVWGVGGAVKGLARGLRALGRALLRKEATSVGTAAAENPALQNALKALYQGTDEIAGGTAGAIRNEAVTGLPTRGVFHLQKGIERARNLGNILRRERLSAADRALAERELANLRDAIRFAQERLQGTPR
jgi:RHS repeat-associated protein